MIRKARHFIAIQSFIMPTFNSFHLSSDCWACGWSECWWCRCLPERKFVLLQALHLLSSSSDTALVWINHGASHKHSERDMNTKSAIDKWIVLVDDSVPVRTKRRLLHFMNNSQSPYQSDIFASLNFLKAFQLLTWSVKIDTGLSPRKLLNPKKKNHLALISRYKIFCRCQNQITKLLIFFVNAAKARI